MMGGCRCSLARALLVAGGLALVSGAVMFWPHWREAQALRHLLGSTVSTAGRQRVECGLLREARPLVLLVLGQSNAGNHGGALPEGSQLGLVTPDGCLLAGDPLPGATGHEGSIWTRLPAALRAQGVERPLVLSMLALDGLPARPWVEPGSPVRARLKALLVAMHLHGMPPDFVLWQQGEADAQLRTSARAWQDSLQLLADLLAENSSQARILLARSTTCRSAPDPALHSAAKELEATNPRFRPGANTDTLLAPGQRRDGCHFSATGLTDAAALWADRLAAELRLRAPSS